MCDLNSMWTDSVDLVRSVPSVVWSGVIGAILTATITLVGVVISNRASGNRQRNDLAHDRDERTREHLHSLRSDLYLELAQSTARVLEFFGRLGSDQPKSDDAFGNFGAACAKSQLVTSMHGLPALVKLIEEVSTCYAAMKLKVMPIEIAKAEVAQLSENVRRFEEDNRRVVDAMKLANESGRPDKHRFDALMRSFDDNRVMIDEWSGKKSAALSRIASLHAALGHDLMQRLEPVWDAQIEAAVALRLELDVATNAAEFRAQLVESRARAKQMFMSMMKDLDVKLE